jgi:hypothetical protein
MIESAVNKLLHTPTTKLRAHAEGGPAAGELAATVRLLFDLQEVAAAAEVGRAERESQSPEGGDERLPH